MTHHKMRYILAIAALALMLIILALGAWLNMASFKKNYVDSLVASYAVTGGECKRKIEYAVKYGKSIDNFLGIQELLQEVKQDSQYLDNVRLVLADGKVLYSLEQPRYTPQDDEVLAPKMLHTADFSQEVDKQYSVASEGQAYHIFMPIRDRQGQWIGILDMVMAEHTVNSQVNRLLKENVKSMLIVAALLALGLMTLLLLLRLFDERGQLRKWRFVALLVGALVLAQTLFAWINIAALREAYLNIAHENTAHAGKIVQRNVNKVIASGITYERLNGIEDWLGKVVRSVPELDNIALVDQQGTILYSAHPDKAHRQVQHHINSLPLVKDQLGNEARVVSELSDNYLTAKLKGIALDAATVLMTSLFFIGELTVLLLLLLKRWLPDRSVGTDAVVHDSMVRPLAFMVYMATDLSVSFIAVRMKELYQPLFALPAKIVIGLPISAEMLCASITAILTGYMLDKRGWRYPFFLGGCILIAGALLSGLAQNALMFIAARSVVGIGYGFTWMALRSYAISTPGAFPGFNAGMYAGMICGCVTGGMLAERIGFGSVFYIAVIIIAAVMLFTISLVQRSNYIATTDNAAGDWKDFFTNRNVLAFFLFITIPSAACLTGFLNYFFPLYAGNLGISPSNVGRTFIIYAVCIVYLGPLVGRFITWHYFKVRHFMLMASAIGILALLCFYGFGSFAAALVAILLFGLADSIGFVAQNNYLMELEATERYGHGKALGFFSMAKKIGQMLGPLLFGWLAAVGSEASVGLIALIYSVAVILFICVTKMVKSKPPITSVSG